MESLFSRIGAMFCAMFSRLGVLLTVAVEQSHWDVQTFLAWGQVIAMVSFTLAFLVGLIYGFGWLVVTNSKRQYSDMRNVLKLMREAFQIVKKKHD